MTSPASMAVGRRRPGPCPGPAGPRPYPIASAPSRPEPGGWPEPVGEGASSRRPPGRYKSMSVMVPSPREGPGTFAKCTTRHRPFRGLIRAGTRQHTGGGGWIARELPQRSLSLWSGKKYKHCCLRKDFEAAHPDRPLHHRPARQAEDPPRVPHRHRGTLRSRRQDHDQDRSRGDHVADRRADRPAMGGDRCDDEPEDPAGDPGVLH